MYRDEFNFYICKVLGIHYALRGCGAGKRPGMEISESSENMALIP